jgi:PRTRC genetic system protein E
MFNELKELLQTRDLVLTLSAVEDAIIRVTVNPKPRNKEGKEKDESKILTAPFVLEGSADELDADFAKTVAEYKTAVQSTEDSIATIKTEAEAAVKAAKAEADQRVKDAKKTAGKPGFAAKPTPPTVGPKKVDPPPPSLFDAPPEQAAGKSAGNTGAFLIEDAKTTNSTEEVDEDGAEDQLAAA